MNFIIPAFIAIGIGLITWLVISSKNKSKFGINLKRVYCPVCGTKQPLIRIPKNAAQAMYGGTTCPGCRTKLNKYGDITQ